MTWESAGPKTNSSQAPRKGQPPEEADIEPEGEFQTLSVKTQSESQLEVHSQGRLKTRRRAPAKAGSIPETRAACCPTPILK
jgi:hypothetical protein